MVERLIVQLGLRLGLRLNVLRIGCRHTQVRLHIAKTLVPTSEGIALTYRVGRCRSRLTLLYRLNLQHCTIPIVEGNGIFGLRFGFNFYRSYRTRVTAICHTHTTTGSPVVHYHGPILVHIDEVRIVEVDDKGILVCSGHEVHRILWRSAQRAIHVHILPFGRMVQVVGLAIVVADEGKLLACILAVGRDTELYVGLQSASSSSHRPRGSTLLMVGLRYMVERLIVQLGLRLRLGLHSLCSKWQCCAEHHLPGEGVALVIDISTFDTAGTGEHLEAEGIVTAIGQCHLYIMGLGRHVLPCRVEVGARLPVKESSEAATVGSCGVQCVMVGIRGDAADRQCYLLSVGIKELELREAEVLGIAGRGIYREA